MEYKALAGPRIRQEAQRCMRAYHEAYRQRRLAPAANSASSLRASAPTSSPGPCWRFFRGELPAAPGSEHVDDLLRYGGEDKSGAPGPQWSPGELERRHDYIQWLFPLRERGVNIRAPLLTTADADAMRGDGLVMARVLQALRVMLRFYGTSIVYTTAQPDSKTTRCASTGDGYVRLQAELRRTSKKEEWSAQYHNLACRSHNYLRISRILQFLGEVGLEPLKVGWLEYLAEEVIAAAPGQAVLAPCRSSFFFWMETPYEEADRARLQKIVERLASEPAAPRDGPVVTVRDVLLPHDLEVSRLIPGDDSSSASSSSINAAPVLSPPGTVAKGTKRHRE